MRRLCRSYILSFKLFLFTILVAGLAGASWSHAEERVLRVAWSLQAPYQYLQAGNESHYATAIDIGIFQAAAARADLSVQMEELPWDRALEGVKAGRIDVVLAAFPTGEREAYGRFSHPLRAGHERLFLPEDVRLAAESLDSLLEALVRSRLRIGIVEGYNLGETFEKFRQQHPEVFDEFRSLDALLHRLNEGQIDGFIVDRFAGYSALSRRQLWSIAPHPIAIYEEEVSALFSKKSTTPAQIARFDEALAALHAEGVVKAIERRFALPVMMDIAL